MGGRLKRLEAIIIKINNNNNNKKNKQLHSLTSQEKRNGREQKI